MCPNNEWIDDSDSKPSHAPKVFFMPDALSDTTLPISALGNQLGICWLAYSEAAL